MRNITPRCIGSLLLALSVCAATPGVGAQVKPAMKAGLSVKVIGGCLMTRVKLAAGGQSMEAHLIIDLGRTTELFLHGNTARLLQVESGDVVTVSAAELELPDLVVSAGGSGLLQFLTMEYARELEDVAVVGYLGLTAFAGQRLEIDYKDGRMIVAGQRALQRPDRIPGTPPVEGEDEAAARRAPDGSGLERLTLTKKDGVYRVAVEFDDGKSGWATLDTGGVDTWCNRHEADLVSGDRKRLAPIRVGRFNVADYAAPRPGEYLDDRVGGGDVALGNGFLSHFKVVVDPHNMVMDLTPVADPEFPEADLQGIAALFAIDFPVIESFLEKHKRHRLSAEVSMRLLEMRVGERPRDMEAVKKALLWRSEAAPPKRRARVMLGLLAGLKRAAPFAFDEVRAAVLEQALKAAEADDDKTAAPKVRSEIGEVLLDEGDLKAAYRHLLSAAFQLPRDGLINLRLGRLYEARGKWERAWSRFLQAAITEEAGPEGMDGLKRLAKQRKLTTPYDVDQMERALEGRVPAFQPAGRYEPPKDAAPSRTVLVELFTGAHCRPCIAADLALDGVSSFFGGAHAVILEHHLHVPAIEPMVNPSSERRGRDCTVRGTPTVLLDGVAEVDASGVQERVTESYRKVKNAVLARLREKTPWKLSLKGKVQGGRLEVTIDVDGPAATNVRLRAFLCEKSVLFPGRNKIVFHRFVNRKELTDGGQAVAKNSGRRVIELKATLAKVTAELEDYLDGVEEQTGRFFNMRPTRIAERQVAVVAFLEDAGGKVLQSALYEVVPTERE